VHTKLGAVALLIALAGCSSSADDADDAFITARWKVIHLATNMEIPCPPGFATAVLHSVPIDETGADAGMDRVDMFDCASGKGTSAPLAPGIYRSWIEITDSTMADVFATSLAETVDITTDDRSFTTQVLEDGGYFKMRWKLVGETSGDELTCDQAGATNGIEAVVTEISTPSNSASDLFECEAPDGITGGYLAGSYTISVSALGPDDEPAGTAPDLTDQVVEARNAVTDLGVVTIPIAD
jgi:hypothetical protein